VIARVSELLQSQLLQPENITPIQPRLAESNLFLLSAGGPAALSFNEFNPLFERDRVTFQLSGLAGEHDTYGAEAVAAAIYGKVSISVGYTHFETDGFRANNDQKDDIANAFVQYELTPRTSLQIEYRYRKNEHGDLALRFFPEDFFPNERTTDETNTLRFGMRHTFTPASVLLGSVILQDMDSRVTDQIPEAGIDNLDLKTDAQSVGAELQHLYRSTYFNLVTGAGYFHVDGETVSNTQIGSDSVREVIDAGLDHVNLYAYSYLNVLKDVTFTLGVSADLLSGDAPDFQDKDQVNPKLGVTWKPFSGTTLRAAGFRVLKRTLITDQTLEPTQVAGFNQFFDDLDGTESWVYGGGLDQKVTRDIFAGVQFYVRDLTVPFFDLSDPATAVAREADWKEYQARAYFFWAVHEWVALRLEYLFERFDRDQAFTLGVRKLDTHRVPIGVNFFHPSGFSAAFTATYYNQDGEFGEGFDQAGFRSGQDDFWVVDASVSYRLPKRLGFITVGATNLLDQSFKYFDTDFRNASIQPVRTVFARVTLALW
jgi:hypothetical protein